MRFNKVSVCVTIFNENETTVRRLLVALNNQTLKPDEIIIIDAKDYDNCSRSKGRNIAIKKARNGIIAITDAGCIPHKDWLALLCSKLEIGEVKNIVVAGGYKMIAKNNFEKAEAVFLGVKQKDIDSNFMPSARSMALTKSVWKKVGGFPERLGNTAEDTMFNIELIRIGVKFVVVKSALVDWQMPDSLFEFVKKIYNYAKGDAESGIWWHPTKKFQTHNLKILTLFLRYILFILFPWLILFYLLYAYIKSGFWGIILQFVSDITGIIGFSHGIFQTGFKRN